VSPVVPAVVSPVVPAVVSAVVSAVVPAVVSAGASVVLDFVLRHSARIHAAAIWNGNFSAGLLGQVALGILAWEKFRLGSDVPSRVLPRLTFQAWGKAVPNHRTPFDWLSRDPAAVDAYIADPLCGFEKQTVKVGATLINHAALADPEQHRRIRSDLPVLLVAGDADPINRKLEGLNTLESWWRDAGVRQIDKLYYRDGRHEMLNETNRDEVTGDIIAWINKTIGASTR